MTFKKKGGALTWLNLVNGCTLLYLFVAGCTPCSAEELFSFVSLVVSLPAHLTVVPVHPQPLSHVPTSCNFSFIDSKHLK